MNTVSSSQGVTVLQVTEATGDREEHPDTLDLVTNAQGENNVLCESLVLSHIVYDYLVVVPDASSFSLNVLVIPLFGGRRLEVQVWETLLHRSLFLAFRFRMRIIASTGSMPWRMPLSVPVLC